MQKELSNVHTNKFMVYVYNEEDRFSTSLYRSDGFQIT